VEQDSSPRGHDDGYQLSPLLLEALAGLGAEATQAIGEVIALYGEFPAWAVWLPYQGRAWAAVRPASPRPPGPDLPMVWIHAATSVELADRMRAVDAQLAGPDR
jgi:hypothetical protein